MTARALAGLFVLNLGYLAVGSSLLWALRGWKTWTEYVRLAGIAYLAGVAALGIGVTALLALGTPFGVAAWLVAVAVVVGGLVAGRSRGRTTPTAGSLPRLQAWSLVTAAGIGLTGVFFAALFRSGRLHALVAFDAWSFWVPKGKALYSFGGFDEQVLAQIPNAPYPPLVPILDAAAFHAMGSADVVTLHVQLWLLALGFATAVVGLLWRRVPSWILWPIVLLALTAPRLSDGLLTPQADFVLQYFVATAALLGGLWILDREPWRLAVVAVLLGGAVLTKREGAVLAAIVLVSLAVVSWDRRPALLRLGAVAVFVVAAGLTWRIWYGQAGLAGVAPTTAESSLERVRDALRLSLEVAFDVSLWSLVTTLGVAAIVLAAIWGERRLALFFGMLSVLVFLGGAAATVSFPDLLISADEMVNPVVRYTGALTLIACAAVPLLLAGVWGDPDEAS